MSVLQSRKSQRPALWLCCLMAVSGSWGCANRQAGPPPPTEWSTGFWFWNGSSASAAVLAKPIDVLYCQVGSFRHLEHLRPKSQWRVDGDLPAELPAARQYWLVFRMEAPGLPAPETVPMLARTVRELLESARLRGLAVAGIQLDIDSPTRTLPEYAQFLGEVRKSLPPGVQISITALLDWFRGGTAVGKVVAQVAEFVPQFYDVQSSGEVRGAAIAARIDAAKWGPVLNRFQRRFRIGVSTFGRSRRVLPDGATGGRHQRIVEFSDLKPLDIALRPDFQLETSRTDAQELVLRYRVMRTTRLGYATFHSGDALEFTLATPESIRAAVEQARLMRGYCAGVLFFRWPAENETLAARPDEVLAAADASSPLPPRAVALRVVDGGCAAVYCADLYLVNIRVLSAEASRFGIASSEALEYFLPNEKLPVRMAGSGRIELTLPPHCGESPLFLGRAVVAKRAEFRLEDQR